MTDNHKTATPTPTVIQAKIDSLRAQGQRLELELEVLSGEIAQALISDSDPAPLQAEAAHKRAELLGIPEIIKHLEAELARAKGRESLAVYEALAKALYELKREAAPVQAEVARLKKELEPLEVREAQMSREIDNRVANLALFARELVAAGVELTAIDEIKGKYRERHVVAEIT